MLKFNNDHLFTGYVKQFLASFNLPKYRIYTKEHSQYKKIHGEESPEILETVPVSSTTYQHSIRHIPYIKDGSIQEYVYNEDTDTSEWRIVDDYYTNKTILNYTKTFKIKNNVYDDYTHEYLGDFLRFTRDYFNINLMPLYNCFSNKICNNLLIDCTHDMAEYGSKKHFIFDSSDKNYKIYMLPVKLFNEYTIAIDCATKVELCCGIFNSYYDETNSEFLAHCTYRQYNGLSFSSPILYSDLKEIYSLYSKSSMFELANREQDLKLFIKVPAISNSSIVVLEGNYLNYNDAWTTRDMKNGKLTRRQNYSVTNLEDPKFAHTLIPGQEPKIISAVDFAERVFNPITPLQLLAANTNISYPFSDKLVEYLLGNVITSADDIDDNIKRVHAVVAANTGSKINNEDGFWDDRLRPVLYNFAQHLRRGEEIGYDTLGYVDKVLEQEYFANLFNAYTGKVERTSIANIDIYPDIYIAMKQADSEETTSPTATPWAQNSSN